jgi:hypothetical protein
MPRGFPVRSMDDAYALVLSRSVVTDSGCREFRHSVNSKGYPCSAIGGKKTALAHRIAWMAIHDGIESGHDVHHKCRNKLCCEITHLESVSRADHAAEHRSTHCKNGHPLEGDTVYVRPNGTRECRVCRDKRNKSTKAGK